MAAPAGRPPTFSADDVEAIRVMVHEQNKTCSEVAKHYEPKVGRKISPETIRSVARRAQEKKEA